AAGGQAGGDRGAVLGALVVVVLELGADAGHLQPQAADARQQAPVGRAAGGDLGVVAGLETGELSGQQVGLGLGVVDEVGAAGELDGRVVAGRDAVAGRKAGGGAPGAGDVGVVA